MTKPTPSPPKPKILLIEDDRFISQAFRDYLERSGSVVSQLYTGQGVVKQVRDWKPDLILLDLILPDKNGFRILEELKGDDDLSQIPVIILTVLSQDADVKKGLDLGAVDYIVKTDYSLSDILDKIMVHLNKTNGQSRE